MDFTIESLALDWRFNMPRNRLLDFEAMLADGERGFDFTMQSVTGTRHMRGKVGFTKNNDPDYPPIAAGPEAWGRMPINKPETEEDTRKK